LNPQSNTGDFFSNLNQLPDINFDGFPGKKRDIEDVEAPVVGKRQLGRFGLTQQDPIDRLFQRCNVGIQDLISLLIQRLQQRGKLTQNFTLGVKMRGADSPDC
jgi:hypothetical protein